MEDTGAAAEIITEDRDTKMGGSVFNLENRARVSDFGNNDDDGSAAFSEPIGESTFDGNSELNFVLADNNNGKINVGNVLDGLENMVDVDEGINGVFGNDGKGHGSEISCEDNEEGMDVDSVMDNNQESGFSVGDLVWGKIRSHPWWPGQVYDPQDASEFALKSKQRGRLLVAFFGDGSWSWCLPSQLVPFVENFSSMSRKSSSKSFVNAVQSAIGEIGRLVELEMACNCVAEERRDVLAGPVVDNAGVKPGATVPEVDAQRLSIRKYESKELIGVVRHFAKTVSSGNAVDLTVLRSCLSAFYYFKGGHQLASYQEPLLVEGLEDNSGDVAEVAGEFGVSVEVPTGPKDEDWQSSPTAGSPGLSGRKVFHKRKRKSVNEIMGKNKKLGSSQKRKKKNSDGKAEEASDQGASSTGKTVKKNKAEVFESPETTTERRSGKNGINKGQSSRKFRNLKLSDVKITPDEAKEEPEIVSTPRERKKSKYLSPPYTNPTWRTGNSSLKTDLEIERDKYTQRGGRTSTPISESDDKTSEENLPNSQPESSDISDDASPPTVKDDINMASSAMLLKIRVAAVDPFYLSKEGSLDMIWAFVYALRSSTYLHGPNYKIFRKCTSRRKKGAQKKENSPDQHASKGSNIEGTPDAAPKSKKVAETSSGKVNTKKVDEKSLACFIMEFATDFPLPSKEDIVQLLGKFGSLRRKNVKIVTEMHSIQISYKNFANAEAAFNFSMSECPFGSNVTCRLIHPSTSCPKVSSRAREDDDLVSDARAMRHKAEIITSILENHESKFSYEEKTNLKEEMKTVMEKVEALGNKVRFMAESGS